MSFESTTDVAWDGYLSYKQKATFTTHYHLLWATLCRESCRGYKRIDLYVKRHHAIEHRPPHVSIPLTDVLTIMNREARAQKYAFQILAMTSKHHFATKTQEEKDQWVEKLNSLLFGQPQSGVLYEYQVQIVPNSFSDALKLQSKYIYILKLSDKEVALYCANGMLPTRFRIQLMDILRTRYTTFNNAGQKINVLVIYTRSSSEACEGMLVFQTMSATDISLVIDHRVREIYRKRGSKKSSLPDTALPSKTLNIALPHSNTLQRYSALPTTSYIPTGKLRSQSTVNVCDYRVQVSIIPEALMSSPLLASSDSDGDECSASNQHVQRSLEESSEDSDYENSDIVSSQLFPSPGGVRSPPQVPEAENKSPMYANVFHHKHLFHEAVGMSFESAKGLYTYQMQDRKPSLDPKLLAVLPDRKPRLPKPPKPLPRREPLARREPSPKGGLSPPNERIVDEDHSGRPSVDMKGDYLTILPATDNEVAAHQMASKSRGEGKSHDCRHSNTSSKSVTNYDDSPPNLNPPDLLPTPLSDSAGSSSSPRLTDKSREDATCPVAWTLDDSYVSTSPISSPDKCADSNGRLSPMVHSDSRGQASPLFFFSSKSSTSSTSTETLTNQQACVKEDTHEYFDPAWTDDVFHDDDRYVRRPNPRQDTYARILLYSWEQDVIDNYQTIGPRNFCRSTSLTDSNSIHITRGSISDRPPALLPDGEREIPVATKRPLPRANKQSLQRVKSHSMENLRRTSGIYEDQDIWYDYVPAFLERSISPRTVQECPYIGNQQHHAHNACCHGDSVEYNHMYQRKVNGGVGTTKDQSDCMKLNGSCAYKELSDCSTCV